MNRVFLDLEGTVISCWTDLYDVWYNERLNQWLSEHANGRVSIFSFAVDNPQDLAEFNTYCKPGIERNYSVNVVACPTMMDIMRETVKINNVSIWQFKILFGKTLGFLKYVESLPDKKGLEADTINLKNLKDFC